MLKLIISTLFIFSVNAISGETNSHRELSHYLNEVREKSNVPAILKEQSFEAMLVPRVKTTWGEIYMGLGWQVYENEYGKVARHPGSVRGYKSLVLTYSDNKNAIIILSNSSGTPRWEIAKSVTDILNKNGEW